VNRKADFFTKRIDSNRELECSNEMFSGRALQIASRLNRITESIMSFPVSMPRRPGAGPVLAYMTAPSRAASAGPAVEWKTGQLWPCYVIRLSAFIHALLYNIHHTIHGRAATGH